MTIRCSKRSSFFEILHAIWAFGCSTVVWILLVSYGCKVIKVKAVAVEEDFDIIIELEGLAV